MPEASAIELAKAGKVRLRLLGDHAIARFLDPEAETSRRKSQEKSQ